ncbi:MAG: molybdate ABC transporter substrate-binding protein [Phycisphaerales bacterium]|nr:molybdate ABC transporter substrate-binding protein [Hyphomonadaceae bacterium]
MIRAITTAVFTGLLLLLPAQAPAQSPDRALVFAAASLTDTLEEIGALYGRESGKSVRFSFAASMTLARQIELSTGADIFISADTESMDYLDQRGRIVKATRGDLLGNRLVLIAPAGSNVTLAMGPRMKILDALAGGRLAMANIDSVPAGRYGKAALTALGVWDGLASRLAQGEDVRSALSYVARGEAPLGIVYATDARVEPRVRVVATFPENTHPPVVYPAALTSEARPDAAPFLAYLRGPQARAVFERAGFTVITR